MCREGEIAMVGVVVGFGGELVMGVMGYMGGRRMGGGG